MERPCPHDGIEILPYPLIGRAAVAARDFELGETVFADRPLIIFPKKRLDIPLFDALDALCDKYYFQRGLLYPIVYFARASPAVKEEFMEFHVPDLEEGTLQYQRYWGSAEEVVKIEELSHLTPKDVVDCLLILRTNVHMLGDVGKASALFTYGSKVSHSCAPNCICLLDGIKLVYRAITNIKKGELITFSYISGFDLWKSNAVRRKLLQEQRFFRCACTRCCGPDMTRMMKCPDCGDSRCLFYDPTDISFHDIQAYNLQKEIPEEERTDKLWTCHNEECGKIWSESDFDTKLEDHLMKQVLGLYFSGKQQSSPHPPELATAMLIACNDKLGALHWLTALMVYTQLALHHTALNRGTKPWSTGKDCIVWSDRLMRWFSLAMPGSMPHAVISKFCGQTAEVYGVTSLACRYFTLALPMIRVHHTARATDIIEMTEYVKKHGTPEQIDAIQMRPFSSQQQTLQVQD